MARKPRFDYFDAFAKMSELAVEYADALVQYMQKNVEIAAEGREPNIEHARARYEELHKIEEASDELRVAVGEAIETEFLAPIEREDIMVLAEELDALIDDLDEVLQVMYMYDVHVIDNDVVKMIQLAHECTEGINALCKELRNFKKPAQFKPMITAVHEAETKADKVFIQAMHDEFVFAKQTNVEFIDAYGQAKLLEALEEICDVCEDVTGTIAMIVMKNS